jgi:NADPH:quinone reductase-like Zn-dependent oxidoreductase
MKAAFYDHYGPPAVLELRELAKPPVGPNSVLVRVRAASVNPYDWHNLRGKPLVVRAMGGLRKPKQQTPGLDWAGTVEVVGEGVTGVKPGDDVFGMSPGAFAEYIAVAPERCVPKPANLTHEQAAAVPLAAVTALQGLRDKGKLQSGQHVLVNGASGGVGTFAVQIAKVLGAQVTAVCSTRNIETVTSLGADRVIDYSREDFTAGAARYDLVFDTVGNRSLSECIRVLLPGGRYVMIAGPVRRLLWMMVARRKNQLAMITSQRRADLVFVADLLEAGKIAPVIDRSYTLDHVAEAIAYIGEGHARGKVVITM